jgi:hypothetical protein
MAVDKAGAYLSEADFKVMHSIVGSRHYYSRMELHALDKLYSLLRTGAPL